MDMLQHKFVFRPLLFFYIIFLFIYDALLLGWYRD